MKKSTEEGSWWIRASSRWLGMGRWASSCSTGSRRTMTTWSRWRMYVFKKIVSRCSSMWVGRCPCACRNRVRATPFSGNAVPPRNWPSATILVDDSIRCQQLYSQAWWLEEVHLLLLAGHISAIALDKVFSSIDLEYLYGYLPVIRSCTGYAWKDTIFTPSTHSTSFDRLFDSFDAFDHSILTLTCRYSSTLHWAFLMDLRTAQRYYTIERTIPPSAFSPCSLHSTFTPYSSFYTASTLPLFPLA